MQHKPWPIVIVALLHWLEPLGKTLLYSLLWRMSPIQLISEHVLSAGVSNIFLYFFSFPLAGIAIFVVRRWSLPVFLAVQLVTLYLHLEAWHQSPQAFPLYILVGFAVINIVIVSYLLFSSIREPFFNSKLRWWETPPRYKVEWSAKIAQGQNLWSADVRNVSLGGVLLGFQGGCEVPPKEPITVSLSYQGKMIQIPGQIVHQSGWEGLLMTGVQFKKMSPDVKRCLKEWLKELEDKEIPRYPERRRYVTKFRIWLADLIYPRKN